MIQLKKNGITSAINEGSVTVFVNGKPAARVDDKTSKDGKITSGAGSVFIGKDGKPVYFGSKGIIKIGKNVLIGGSSKHHKEKAIGNIPFSVQTALKEAMKYEHVPNNQYNSLAWIMAQESNGRAGVKCSNPKSSARGLFQLNKKNYHFNPNGEKSFGDPVEESQGGIRYINARYGNADNAAKFWRAHQWY